MKKIKLLLFPLFLFLLTGCYNYREVNNLAITSAIGIDKEGDEYITTAQVVTTKKSTGNVNASENIPSIVYTSKGNTIQEALRKTVLESPKRLYASHLEILVIGDALAKEGIEEILEFFFRDPEIRMQFLVVIAKNASAEDVLECLTPLETISAQNIRDTIETDMEFFGTTRIITFEEMMKDYLNDRVQLLLPTIELINNTSEKDKLESLEEVDSESEIKLSGLAAFQEDKLIYFLDNEESIYANMIMNKIENTVINYQCENKNYIAIEIIKNSASIENKKNSLDMNISIEGNGNIIEMNCDENLEDPKVIKEIEKKINKKIEDEIEKNINTMIQQYHTDIYGFEDIVYKSNYSYYKNLDKENLIQKLQFNIQSNIKLIEKGYTLKGTKNEK